LKSNAEFQSFTQRLQQKLNEGLIGYIVLKLQQKLTCVLHICIQFQGAVPLDTLGHSPQIPIIGSHSCVRSSLAQPFA